VPGEGFEPPTFGLQNRCTATVLTRRIKDLEAAELCETAFCYLSATYHGEGRAVQGRTQPDQARFGLPGATEVGIDQLRCFLMHRLLSPGATPTPCDGIVFPSRAGCYRGANHTRHTPTTRPKRVGNRRGRERVTANHRSARPYHKITVTDQLSIGAAGRSARRH
jgi:hypothetical protein